MIGWLSCPEGWETMENSGKQYFKSATATQSWTTDSPPGAKPEGVIALANAIPDMEALLSLDMSNNSLNSDSNRGMDYLGPAVAASKITSLNIASNFLSKNGGIAAIASMLDKGGLAIGCTVAIQGLSKSPKLNGKEATVLQRITMADAFIEAYEVKIVETGEFKKLKRANLAGGKANNGALIKLDISSNNIGGEHEGELQCICVASGIDLAK
jgi:hypothetical protein